MSTSPTPTRVLIVDDQALMREGLQTLLELQEGIAVVGVAANGREALENAESLRPDVVLMDLRMPEMDGIAATQALKTRYPSLPILVLTTFDDDELIVAALQAGASGYVLKDRPSEQLARDLRAVHAGDATLSPRVTRKVIDGLLTRSAPRSRVSEERPSGIDAEGRESPSEREVEVLRLAAKGLSNREIGQRLYITEGTVKNHISAVLAKLHLRDRTQAVLYAHEHGLL